MKFSLQSKYKPSGDQPQAIEKLVTGINIGHKYQTLLGVTGSGKTFTMANVIEQTQLPTLVIAHNKTLAAQLCNEFREFFPKNAVHYFVSYYDYYQPEAYMPGSDTYIEKEAQVNIEIDRLRHECTQALLSRRDVIIVASVSAIYGLGSPIEYERILLHLTKGQKLNRRGMMEQLVEMQFTRTTADLKRGTFRMRGQTFEIIPINQEMIYRFEISDQINSIELLDPITRQKKDEVSDAWFFPAKHYVITESTKDQALQNIKTELTDQLASFKKQGKLLESERLKRKVKYDLEMIHNIGYCNGIENYSRHLDGRQPGQAPFTLLDYFLHTSISSSPSVVTTGVPSLRGRNDEASLDCSARQAISPSSSPVIARHEASLDYSARRAISPSSSPVIARHEAISLIDARFLTIIDESHVTLPQIRAMYNGDQARKNTLVEHGFRLPSAKDNRPLTFDEFEAKCQTTIYTSATPTDFEKNESAQIVEQIVRPTGLIDPAVVIKPITGPNTQIEDLITEIKKQNQANERTLVTTLTKRMAEDLTDYLQKQNIKVTYLHSEVHTIERIQVINNLRHGKIDVVVGVNLLREGLDIPEVSLVAILDADKEGFLRSETSLIQTIGRAARNVNGRVILYADQITGSIKRAISETDRRRKIQLQFNTDHNITPKTIQKAITDILADFGLSMDKIKNRHHSSRQKAITQLDILGDNRPLKEIIADKEAQMRQAAKKLEFELAAILRDEILELNRQKKKISKQ